MRRIGFLWVLLTANIAYGFTPFIIKDIQVTGLQRVAIGTIFNYLPLAAGDEVDEQKLAAAVKNLYAHGMFKDLSIERDGNILIVRVLERPIISKIEFIGNKDINTKALLAAFKRLGLAPSLVLKKNSLEKAALELQQQYIAKGRYGTKVIIHQVPLERNRVTLKIEVQEGVQALVKSVKFIGNKSFSNSELLSGIVMKPTNWWQIFSTQNRFSQELLLSDATRISNFYFNQGFKNFKLISSNVVLTKNKKNIVVSYQIDEGERFTINNAILSGVEDHTIKKELLGSINIEAKQIYGKNELINIKKRLESKLGELGYALAEVTTKITIVDDEPMINVDFVTELGQVTYIREINIFGNTSTRDDVIRRELREYEGGRFIASEIRLSTNRLRRLGYFQIVTVSVKPVPESNNQVDVVYTVVEASTGSAKLGVTYSQNYGAGLNISLSHNNFLGTGKKYSLVFVSDKVTRKNLFSVQDPYFTDYGMSINYNVFNTKTNTTKVGVASYIENNLGLGVTLGIPVNEYDRVYFGSRISQADFTCGSKFTECQDYGKQYNSKVSGDNYRLDLINLSLSWSRDSRNSSIFPTNGQFQQLAFTQGIGDAKFQKTSFVYKQYFPLFEQSAIKLTADLALGTSNKSSELPFFERYFVGGLGTVRGFTSGSLGEKNANNRNLGGSFKTVFNFDFITPFFLAPNQRSVRMTTFIDAGYSLKNQSEFSWSKLNSSYGMGVLWMSPVAPLSFTVARPINSENSANEQFFQFQIGYRF